MQRQDNRGGRPVQDHRAGFQGRGPAEHSLGLQGHPDDLYTGRRRRSGLIELSGGEIVQISDVGAPVGTTIEVGELFFNTPARLKYLSSSRAETRRVVDTMSKLALARPDVSLRLRVDDRLVFSTSGSGDLIDAAAQVMGTELARKMIPVSKEIDGMSISGLIAHPDKAKSGRDDQYFSVNGRPFVSKTAWVASDRAADRLIPAGKTLPFGVLWWR